MTPTDEPGAASLLSGREPLPDHRQEASERYHPTVTRLDLRP